MDGSDASASLKSSPDLISIPVASVDATWLQSQFYPSIESLFSAWDSESPAIIWLLADSGEEGEFLLRRIEKWLGSRDIAAHQFRVEQSDPLLVWEQFVGVGDEEIPITKWNAESILLIYGAQYLPSWFVRQKLPLLDQICRALRLKIIAPMLRDTGSDLMSTASVAAASLVHIPSLIDPEDTSEDGLKELIAQLVERRLGGLSIGSQARLIDGILMDRPSSRTQLEQWIDFYSADEIAESEQRIIAHEPPPRMKVRGTGQSAGVASRNDLKRLFEVAWFRLKHADQNFRFWSGEPLLEASYAPPDPFEPPDPSYWFVVSVSALYCTIYDAGSDGLTFMSKYQYDFITKDVLAGDQSKVFEDIRALRLFMQHAMNPSSSRNRETMNRARSWFFQVCGSDEPKRHHWRSATRHLLDDWDRAVARILDATNHLSGCPSEQAIGVSWRLLTRPVSREWMRQQFLEVVAEIDPSLNANSLADKYHDKISADLKSRKLGANSPAWQIRELVQHVVVDASATCPVSWSDLENIGIPPGPNRGRLLQLAREEWKRDPCLNPETLLEWLRQKHEGCSGTA